MLGAIAFLDCHSFLWRTACREVHFCSCSDQQSDLPVDCLLHDCPQDIPNFELGYTETLRCGPTPGKGVEAMSSYSAAIGRRFGRPPGLQFWPGLNGFRFASRLAFPGSELFTVSFTVLSESDSTAVHRFNTTRGGAYIAVGGADHSTRR